MAITIQRWSLSKRYRCQAAPYLPQSYCLLGTDTQKVLAESKSSGHNLMFMRSLFDRLGDTFQANIWGQPWIFTCDKENFRAVNTDQSACFGVEPLRKTANSGWMGDGIFISDGVRWQQARALFKPLFARAQISEISRFEKHLGRMRALIPADGTALDLQPLFRRLYLDVSFEYLLGEQADSLLPTSNIDIDRFHHAFETATAGMSKRHALGRGLIFSRGDVECEKSYEHVHSIFDACIDSAIAQQNASSDDEEPKRPTAGAAEADFSMLRDLVQITDDRLFIRNQLLNVFLGAKDTATIGISNVFFHLARHPHVWERLRHEVLQEKRALDFNVLKSLKYLQMVVRESLRLLSPVDISSRICVRDCVLPRGGGVDGTSPIYVRKGSRFEGRLGSLHRDKAFWGEDAMQFRPERWEDDDLRPRWEYIPFSGGGRICPAQQMCLTQYAYILAQFAREFRRIENRDPVLDYVEEIKFGKQSRNGVQVALYRDS